MHSAACCIQIMWSTTTASNSLSAFYTHFFFLSLFLFCSCFLSDFRFQKCKYGNVVCASRGLSLFLSLSLVLCNVCTARLPQQERYTHNTREMHIQHTHIAKLYQPYRIGLTDVIANKYRPKWKQFSRNMNFYILYCDGNEVICLLTLQMVFVQRRIFRWYPLVR